MKRNWDLEELIEHFTIMPNEMATIGNKFSETKLGFIVLLKFFQVEAKFPNSKHEISKDIVQYIAKQVQVKAELFEKYDMSSRTYYIHKSQIREFFGFRESTSEDANAVTEWLSKLTFYQDLNIDNLNIYEDNETDCNITDTNLSFSDLRSDSGRICIDSVLKEIMKLKMIRQINLPDNLFNDIPQKVLKKYKQRVVSEDLRELRRHPEPSIYTLLSVFFWLRCREITDNLIELLIQIIHRIGVRAERKVEKEFINDFKRINGKTNILFKMADAALNNPDGVIKQVLFPVVSETTLTSLLKEFKNTGSAYKQKVYTLMRSSSHMQIITEEWFQRYLIQLNLDLIMKFINL